ncbi:MAG: serine/threonine protein kinase [Proteobacteria bacterium]|nr:serine/threonine protein kinase [Pseudomonadota bacterium]
MNYSASISLSTARTTISGYSLGIADTISGCTSFKEGTSRQHSLASEIRDGVGDTAVTRYIDKIEPDPESESSLKSAPGHHQKTVQFTETPKDSDKNRVFFAVPSNTAAEQINTDDRTLSNELATPTRRHILPLAINQSAETVELMDDNLLSASKESVRLDSREVDIGKVIGNRYEILSEISRGGFGIVYRARQIGLDRVVALKRLHAQNDYSNVKRFFLEANIIKDLVHPNTIQLIDAGMDDNHLYYVMEYIEGKSLRELIDMEHSLDPLRSLNITKQILKSIHEAHERGIIHRDLKPSNILIRNIIGEQDFVKVLDFGIAKVHYKGMPRLTENGKIMGTPQYLAPELLYGDEATQSTDLFSIALILVEMLTGKALLPKSPVSIVKLSTSPEPIPIPQWILQSPMGDMLRRALNKDPDFRYRNAADMIADIQRVEACMRFDLQNTSKYEPKQTHGKSLLFSWFAIIAGLILLNVVFFVCTFILY